MSDSVTIEDSKGNTFAEVIDVIGVSEVKKAFQQSVKEGSLHKWFKGSKSKDGKPGWVNVVTGGTCASDKPGEGTPKCVSASKRASMTKAERLSASRRKKKADPGQQAKSGAAKPTYVSTDKKKKMNEQIKRDEYGDPIGGPKISKKQLKKNLTSNTPDEQHTTTTSEGYIDLPLEVEIPNTDARFRLGLMFRESLEVDKGMLFIFEGVGKHSFHMKNTRIPLDIAFVKEDGTIESIKELTPYSSLPVYSDGQVLFAIEANRGWFTENNVEVGDEIVLGEAKDKKGKGSGSKDACYHKVKSRYSVWPSAYASGALVKCRKVGAANWGNKSESVEYEVNEGLGATAVKAVAKTVGKKLGKATYKVGQGIQRVKDRPGPAAVLGATIAAPLIKANRDKNRKQLPVNPSTKKIRRKSDRATSSGNAGSSTNEHYSWRDSFDLEERTIAQQNSMQQRNKDAARSRAQEMAKQRIGSGTAKNPDTTIAQAKQQNQASMRTNARARNVDFRAERRPAAKPMASNPQGMRQQGVGKSANDLSRHSAGSSAAAGAAKPAAGKPGLLSRIGSGIKRVAGGVADAATGNRFDFDKRGGQRPAPQAARGGATRPMRGSGARNRPMQRAGGQAAGGATRPMQRAAGGAQDALNRNPGRAPQKQDALNRNPGQRPVGTPATASRKIDGAGLANKMRAQNNQSGSGGQRPQGSTGTLTSSAGSLQKNRQKANRIANAANRAGGNVSVGKITGGQGVSDF